MKITIDDVARELEITPENVRFKIDSGELPIAIVGGTDRRKSYTVLPSKLYEATGIKRRRCLKSLRRRSYDYGYTGNS